MNYQTNRRDSRILRSLKKCATSAEQIGGGRWSFALVNGKSFGVAARTVDEWLLLDAPVTDRIERGDMWDVLRKNATLEGLVKFVLMPNNRSVHLRAEIPLLDEESCERDCEDDADDKLVLRISEACGGLKAAFRSFGDGKTKEQAIESGNSELADESSFQKLLRVCGDAGWPFLERSAEKLVVELDAPGIFYQASVEGRSAGAHVSVDIALFDALSAMSRQAMSMLLLKTGGLVRLARPSIEERENRIAARFEVIFGTIPNAVELAHALSSLSVACSLCGREARAMKDEILARAYLALPGEQASLLASSAAAVIRKSKDEEAGRESCALMAD